MVAWMRKKEKVLELMRGAEYADKSSPAPQRAMRSPACSRGAARSVIARIGLTGLLGRGLGVGDGGVGVADLKHAGVNAGGDARDALDRVL